MDRRLIRPAAALFPLAGLIACRAGGEEAVGRLFLFYYALQLCSLCAVDSFRNGAGREPGVRRVDRRFGGAVAQLALGIALLLVVGLCWPVARASDVGLFAAAACVLAEQLFEERMWALGRRVDGAILSVIASVLLLTGLLLDISGGIEVPAMRSIGHPFTLFMAALGMLIAIITSYAVEPAHGFSLKPANLKQVPGACAQTLLCPAALASLLVVGHTGVTPLLYGLILWRLSRTVCRRTQEESRPLNLLLTCLAAIPGLVVGALPELGAVPAYHRAALLALICAAIVFCAPTVRLCAGIALLIAADALIALVPLPRVWNSIAVYACCAAAVALNLYRVFQKRAPRPDFLR